jgi:hypothetical protein
MNSFKFGNAATISSRPLGTHNTKHTHILQQQLKSRAALIALRSAASFSSPSKFHPSIRSIHLARRTSVRRPSATQYSTFKTHVTTRKVCAHRTLHRLHATFVTRSRVHSFSSNPERPSTALRTTASPSAQRSLSPRDNDVMEAQTAMAGANAAAPSGPSLLYLRLSCAHEKDKDRHRRDG